MAISEHYLYGTRSQWTAVHTPPHKENRGCGRIVWTRVHTAPETRRNPSVWTCGPCGLL